jgi:hypothetical protein
VGSEEGKRRLEVNARWKGGKRRREGWGRKYGRVRWEEKAGQEGGNGKNGWKVRWEKRRWKGGNGGKKDREDQVEKKCVMSKWKGKGRRWEGKTWRENRMGRWEEKEMQEGKAGREKMAMFPSSDYINWRYHHLVSSDCYNLILWTVCSIEWLNFQEK